MNYMWRLAGSHNNLYREAGMNRSGNTGITRLLNIVGEAFFM